MNVMEREANSILKKVKDGNISIDKARRMLFLLTGVTNTDTCKLNRVKEDCSVYLYTKLKCDGCFYKC